MPDEAMPRALRLLLGKPGTLKLWNGVYHAGETLGRKVGRAEGAIAGGSAGVLGALALWFICRAIRSR